MGHDRQDVDLGRRDALKLTAAATLVALGTPAVVGAQQAAPPRFFTPAEFALVDELAELIIPADGHAPGARAAGVARFIDGQLAEAWTQQERDEWRQGLAAVDETSRLTHGKRFLDGDAAERLAVLTAVARRETAPETTAERFFLALKSRVAFAYYTSEIGIKQEMNYQGNVLLQEFVGYDVRQK